jgi:hypothetical protein
MRVGGLMQGPTPEAETPEIDMERDDCYKSAV